MYYPAPLYLTPFIMTGMVAIITAVLLGLNRALQSSPRPQTDGPENDWPEKDWPEKDLSEKDRAKAFWSLSLLLMAWFVVATLTSLVGFYQPPSGSAPTIQYGLVIPIVLGVLLFRAWPLLRRTLAVIPNSWLVGVQLYRALGVIFLILYAGGHLPALFALPAGIGDVLVGILAPVAATAYARSPQGARLRVWLWNLLGITDLVVAVTMGFLTSPSPLQAAAFDRPSVLIGMFPLSLIPVFGVPLSILLHLASLRKLRADQSADDRTRGIQQVGPSGHRVTA